MKILFKEDNNWIYYIKYNILTSGYIEKEFDLSNVPHLDDTEPLYHYRSNNTNKMYPVYYEHIGRFITEVDGVYYHFEKETDITKDYTLINLKLI